MTQPWFQKKPRISTPSSPGLDDEASRRMEGLWVKCDACGEILLREELEKNQNVCPSCNHHMAWGARLRLAALCDEGTFEEFDAVGSWRKPNSSKAIDAKAELPTGVTINGMRELKDELLRTRSDDLRRTMLRRVASYALGRSLTLIDMEAMDALLPSLKKRDDGLAALRERTEYMHLFPGHLNGVRNAAKNEEYLIEPFISGTEATCGVLEQSDGKVFSLPPIEIVAAEGRFDYTAKYLLKSTQEICPGRFTPEVTAQLQDFAVKAHRALSCSGYTRSDFIISAKGPIYLETNTLPGLTKASLYPKALKAQGIEFTDFLHDQITLAIKRVQK